MSEATAISNVKSATLSYKISNISKLESICSPEVTVQGEPWNVSVRKVVSDAKQSLGIYLHSAKKDTPLNWTHVAFAKFKLLSFDSNQNAIEQYTAPYVFDSSGLGYGLLDFISWTDLFDAEKNYVKDDTIKLEIEIEAEDTNENSRSQLKLERIEKCCDESWMSILRLTITNIENLMAVRSPGTVLREIPWTLIISKNHSSNLVIGLNSDKDYEISCKVKMSVKLVSSKADVQPIKKVRENRIGYTDLLRIDPIISWDELMKPENGFIKDNSITLDVEIEVDKPEGVKSKDVMRDRTKRSKLECAICLEFIEDQETSITSCGHLFCSECIKKAVKDRQVCPSCNARVTLKGLRRAYLPMLVHFRRCSVTSCVAFKNVLISTYLNYYSVN